MLRRGLLALTLLACLLLAVAEFTDLYSIRNNGLDTVLKSGTAGGHHGYALLLIALVGAGMAYGAFRSAPAAAIALIVLGVAALLICLIIDAPDLDKTGKFGKLYEAHAQGEIGFKLETAGSVLLIFAGVLTAVLGRPAAAPARSRRAAPPVADEGEEAA